MSQDGDIYSVNSEGLFNYKVTCININISYLHSHYVGHFVNILPWRNSP